MAQAAMMDTHEEFTKLVEAGADEKLAEAVVKLHARAQVTDSVTKADLKNTETLLRSEIADVQASLKSEISEVRTSLESEISEVRTSLESQIVGVRTEIADVKSDLKWMKGIGAAILAAVVIPMLTELL